MALKRKGQLNEDNRKIEKEVHTKKACLEEVGKYHSVYYMVFSFSFPYTVDSVPCIVRSGQCTVYSAQWTVYSV